MVVFDYEQDVTSIKNIGFLTKCVNSERDINFYMTNKEVKSIIPIFIKIVLFQHVGLYWLIQSKYQIEYDLYDLEQYNNQFTLTQL